MARTANQFQDPAGVRTTYDWVVNHSEEEEFGKERNIEHSAPTGGVGLVRQQGADAPMVLELRGVIFHEAQYQEFWAWWKLSRTQTIYFHDFAGDSYEVVFTSFKPTRHRTIRNPKDYSNAPYWFWRYTMRLEVVRFIDGPLATAGVDV